jgi:hypothetical protein
MSKILLSSINMRDVRRNYLDRKTVGEELRNLLASGPPTKFAELALGISNPTGNYSAAEHALGPKILSQRSPTAIKSLAQTIVGCDTAASMLDEIYKVNIPWLKVGVGSEMAMLLKPKEFWVANTRTVWAHLLLKHKFALSKANEELQLYRSGDQNSEMAYKIWRAIYLELGSSVVGLTARGNIEAAGQGITPGKRQNLWFDSIANALYQEHGG